MLKFALRHFCTILFAFQFLSAEASDRDIDSLIRLMRRSTDTTTINLMNQLSWEYRNMNPDLTDSFARMAIDRSIKYNYDKGTGQGYITLAILERNEGNYDNALQNARWALLHFIKAGWLPGYASAYNTIASIHSIRGNFTHAIFYYFNSLKISDQIHDIAGKARAYNNIGVVYQDCNKLDKALLYFKKSYQLFDSLGDEDAIADELNNIGTVYHMSGQHEKAITCFVKTIDINKRNNDLKNVSTAYNNIGSVYSIQQDYKNALVNFFQALSISENLRDVESMILNYNNITDCYLKLEMLHMARIYADNALKLALKHKLNSSILNSYELLYRIEEAKGDYKTALAYHELFKSYSDSFSIASLSEKIELLEKQYEQEKLEKSKIIETKDSEITQKIHIEKEKRITQYIVLIGMVLLLFVVLIYVVFFILKWQKSTP